MSRGFTSPTLDVRNRDYFRALSDPASAEPFIGRPTRSLVNQAWSVFVARRLEAGPGGFAAILVGVVPLERLAETYQSVAAVPGSAATLLSDDRVVMARFPWDEAMIGRVAPPPDHDMLLSAHRLPQAPLTVEVTLSDYAALASWRRQVLAITVLTAATVMGVAIMLYTLLRQFRTQRANRDALTQRNQDLEQARSDLEHQTRQLEQTAAALRGGEALLAERSATLDTTLEYMDQGIMMVNAAGEVAAFNHRVVEMLDIPEELLARRPAFREILQFQWETGEFARTGQSLREFVLAGGILDEPHVYQRQRPNGRWVEIRSLPLPGGGMVRTYTDITDRKEAESRIERAALFDELTALPNRLSLRRELERRLAASEGAELALLYLNLDRFRLLNDARGHEAGDRLLMEAARRLQGAISPEDFLSRTGGDEFAVLHDAKRVGESPAALGDRLLQVLAEPHVINGLRLQVTVSIGIALASEGASTDALLRNADIAMYRAKDAGRNRHCQHEPSMTVAQQERFQLEQSLREALGSRAFRLAYQPIVSLETNSVAGYEALLRWTDRVRGEVSPQLFIPVAEATGLIVPLGRTVLETACQEAATWPTACSVAVNLSPVQFRGGGLVETVTAALQRSGLAPERLELEVTEGVLLEDSGAVHETMVALREAGVSLTLDDFGTGHAGLSYLRRFPFNKIKIDRSFVRNLGVDRESDAIVEAILLLGRRLNLKVVAEGVEYEAQLEQLRSMRCPYVQGYLTGRPVTAEVARAL